MVGVFWERVLESPREFFLAVYALPRTMTCGSSCICSSSDSSDILPSSSSSSFSSSSCQFYGYECVHVAKTHRYLAAFGISRRAGQMFNAWRRAFKRGSRLSVCMLQRLRWRGGLEIRSFNLFFQSTFCWFTCAVPLCFSLCFPPSRFLKFLGVFSISFHISYMS